MARAFTFLSIPGWQNSPAEHWQSLWERSSDGQIRRVVQRDWEQAERGEWVRGIEEASRILEGIRGVRFEWLTGGSDVGVIAQEVATVLPEAVRGGNPFIVEYWKIVPVLVEVVKELLGRVASLESRS